MPVVHAVSALAPDVLAREAPDHHWTLNDEQGAPIGRCSLWWQNTPAYRDHRVGIIGHYAARDGSAARLVLKYVCEQLSGRGCTIVIGPMDGNTWRQYRLVSDPGSEPPFFLEPQNPDDWPDHFVANGFEPLAQYFSALNANLRHQVAGLCEVAHRMAVQGVRIRPLEGDQFDDDLRRIYAIATIAFRDNLFYSPLAEPEFIAQYRALSRLVPMNLVLIAERQDRPIGFVFAVPDLLQAQRGEPIDTIIVKSLGVLPGRHYAGLGNLLLASVEKRACELGYVRSVYALVRDLPHLRRFAHLRRMSGRYALPIRRYALFAKVIRR